MRRMIDIPIKCMQILGLIYYDYQKDLEKICHKRLLRKLSNQAEGQNIDKDLRPAESKMKLGLLAQYDKILRKKWKRRWTEKRKMCFR